VLHDENGNAKICGQQGHASYVHGLAGSSRGSDGGTDSRWSLV